MNGLNGLNGRVFWEISFRFIVLRNQAASRLSDEVAVGEEWEDWIVDELGELGEGNMLIEVDLRFSGELGR